MINSGKLNTSPPLQYAVLFFIAVSSYLLYRLRRQSLNYNYTKIIL